MAKYDEFGRPIYETAEEYNKAHKGGVCPRGYDTSTGDGHRDDSVKRTYHTTSAAQRQANQAGMNKAKKIIIAMAVFFIAIYVGIFVSLMVDTEFGEGEVEMESQITDYVEIYGDSSTPLPDGFDTFFYNIRYCTLPAQLDEITGMGLELTEYNSEEEMFSPGWEEIRDLSGDMGSVPVTVRINNLTEREKSMWKCTVDLFIIVNPAVYYDYMDIPDFEFGDGLTFESSYEEVYEYFGEPSLYIGYSTDGYYYDHYEWSYYGEDEIQYVSVTYCDGMMLEVTIEKKPNEEKY